MGGLAGLGYLWLSIYGYLSMDLWVGNLGGVFGIIIDGEEVCTSTTPFSDMSFLGSNTFFGFPVPVRGFPKDECGFASIVIPSYLAGVS